MSTTFGPDRSKIYKYLQSKGLTVTDEIHAELKALLIEYVEHHNEVLLKRVAEYQNHMRKCEMFLQRQKNKTKVNVKVVKK